MHFTTSDGLTLAYRDEGAGLPVLCLPGLSRNSEDFDPLVSAFAAEARIIRLDPRGRGASQPDPDFRNYSVPVEARDALELLDHLGIARAAIIGTSRGGILAMAIAAVAKPRLAGVVLVDIGPEIAPVGIARILGYLGLPPGFATLDEAAHAMAGTTADQFPGVSPAAWQTHLGRIWRETPEGLALRYDARLRDAFVEQMEGAGPGDLWPLFDALSGVPLAVIRGALSDILTAETAAAMLERRPDMIFAEVPDRGHVPFLDEPEAVAAIRALLARVPA
jgi:pimeloyl-ACP methyl ester carboxylesterase